MTGTISPVKFAFQVDGPKLLASLLSVLSSVGSLSKAPTKMHGVIQLEHDQAR
jgi:hypothetical protein